MAAGKLKPVVARFIRLMSKEVARYRWKKDFVSLMAYL